MMVVVIGGTGFIGRALVARLRATGVRVRTYSRRSASSEGDQDHISGELNNARLLKEAVRGAEIVFHLAWTTVPQTSNEDIQSDIGCNLGAGCGLLEACRDEGNCRVIFMSSGGTVYGTGHSDPLDETAPTEPICSYGITKLAFEKYLALYRHLYGLDYRVLRVSNAYGEGQPTNRPQGLIGVTLERLIAKKPIAIWGDGQSVRDYIYLEDVVDCCVAAMRPLSEDAPRVFNVSTQTGHSVQEVLATIRRITSLDPIVNSRPARGCDVDRIVLSNSRAYDFLGWVPKFSLTEGLERTWASVQYNSNVTSKHLANFGLSDASFVAAAD